MVNRGGERQDKSSMIKAIRMSVEIGQRYNVPESISPTKVIQVVGSERNERGKCIKVVGAGDTILHCCEVHAGRATGFSKAIGSDMFADFLLVV